VDAELTELIDIDPARVDLVKRPANGFPILVMKAVNAPAQADETPDTSSGTELEKDSEVPETQDDTKTSPVQDAPEVTAPVEKSAQELVDEAVAKAVAPFQETIEGLRAEMAVLKSTPIPGGPMVTVPAEQRRTAEKAGALAEAARFERLAKDTGIDRELRSYYEERAAEVRKAANG
jgi:hypothetical protein